MSLDANKTIDPHLMHFIETETHRQKFTQQVHNLADTCWDVCLGDSRPAAKMDGKTQTCVVNCVDRFIDASAYILQRMNEMGPAHGGNPGFQ